METIGIVVVFLAMLAAPCAVAMRSSQKANDLSEPDFEEPIAPAKPMLMSNELDRPLSLMELAVRAEGDAMIARELAREAQAAALAATAHAAQLRADAAVEAAHYATEAANAANRADQLGYLPGDHPSLDFPRSRVRRQAA